MPYAEKSVPVRDVEKYMSGDFWVLMSEAFDKQIEAWKDYQDGMIDEDDIHPSELEYGGPEAYVSYLAEVMREKGWVGPPLDVDVQENGLHVVNNGHHRFIATTPARMEEIPMSIYYIGEDDEWL